ncbi:MAG: cation:proton antiporter [Betaproteobacteria bacterium AqS2]|uniref:Cation:proton antiporter n=1 Tax=Candidatus Amphirhobacter heronislandensis TaxID=1732024 RepID=A0A930UGQ7_9GAMM|nr:cation:proton antiporter [Betaproteobacteria bacterium AqS2]
MNLHVPEYIFIMLAASLVLITVLRRFKLPTIFGYLILGMLLGPHGAEFFAEGTDVTGIAELGIMAIMFSIGLEFSFSRLITARRYVFGIGGFQVMGCAAVVVAVMKYGLGFNWHDSLLAGAVISLSSTAVISKMLIEEGLLSSPQGTRSISVLIFQDLAFIPMLILANYTTEGEGASDSVLSLLASSVGILALILIVAPRVMPLVVDYFAKLGSSEIFTIFVLTLIMGISVLTYKGGLSMALGSFLTGMLLSESRHRFIIHDIIKPFREIFLGFFFVSIGLLIDPNAFYEFLVPIVLGCLAVLVLKPLFIYGTVKLFGSHHWTAIYTGLALGGTGEFGFVLLTAAAASTDSDLLQILFAINLVCMGTAPIMIDVAQKVKDRLLTTDWLIKARDLTRAAQQGSELDHHVIIAGFGQNARILVRLLNRYSVPWLAIESNYQLFDSASKAGLNVIYGDSCQEETMLAANLFAAKALVLTHGIQANNVRTIEQARNLRKDLPIFIKVQGQAEIAECQEAGASYIAVTSMEIGAALAKETLREFNVRPEMVEHEARTMHDTIVQEGGMNIVHDIATSYYDSEDADRRRPHPLIVAESNGLPGKARGAFEQTLQKFDIALLRIERGDQLVEMVSADFLEEGDVLIIDANDFQMDALLTKLLDDSVTAAEADAPTPSS